jgi:hypothetical protein
MMSWCRVSYGRRHHGRAMHGGAAAGCAAAPLQGAVAGMLGTVGTACLLFACLHTGLALKACMCATRWPSAGPGRPGVRALAAAFKSHPSPGARARRWSS